MEYTLRNVPLTVAPVEDLLTLFDLGGVVDKFVMEKEKARTDSGVTELCLRAREKDKKDLKEEFCVDAGSHDLSSETWSTPSAEERSKRFDDYVAFEGRRYPRRLSLFIKGERAATANITSLESAPFIASLLTPPPGAIERRKCPNMKPPEPNYRPEPEYEDLSQHRGTTGPTVLGMTVHKDGSVSDVYVIEPGAPFLTKPAIDALKRWKFKPARCGSESVDTDAQTIFNFNFVSSTY
jgi:TonB family protein